MTARGKRVNKARLKGRQVYEYICVKCKSSYSEGCHIFEAGKPKYIKLADNEYNIISLCVYHHREFDEKKYVWQKIRWLFRNIQDEFYSATFKRRYKILKEIYKELRHLRQI